MGEVNFIWLKFRVFIIVSLQFWGIIPHIWHDWELEFAQEKARRFAKKTGMEKGCQ